MPNKPPSEWWDRHYNEVKKGNPDYSDEQVRKTVGDIWYNKMSPSKKHEETKKSEGSLVEKKAQGEPTQTFKISFGPTIHQILSERHEGQNDPLYALISRTTDGRETEATANELLAAREELMNAFQEGKLDEQVNSEITAMISDIDSLVFSGDQGDLGDLGSILDDALGQIDQFQEIKDASKKQAAGFPNMLSNDTKKWIQLQTTNLAAKKGIPATPEQAHAYIDEASVEVAQELANAIGPEVKKVVDEFREKIFQDITAGAEIAAPAAKPAAPTGPAAPAPTPMPPAPPAEPVAASEKKAKMSETLKKAFDQSYAYDALAFILDAELGSDFTKKVSADELIDEEEAILDLAQQDFPNASRKELSKAFGEVLTDAYSKAE